MQGHFICLLFFGPKKKWLFRYFYFLAEKRKPVYGRPLNVGLINLICWFAFGVIHKGCPHRGGRGVIWTKTEKGEGVTVQVDVHIYTTCRPRWQCYKTVLLACILYIAQGISASIRCPVHLPTQRLSVQSVAAACCFPSLVVVALALMVVMTNSDLVLHACPPRCDIGLLYGIYRVGQKNGATLLYSF